ncbi:helix-turn-helix domain-containing protein [Aestuariibius insulae]|uniref:helix-turn-helix transcriptional regulator n=1 Tax=Aestuariibius insulae TaxID=2058287 RepID=UPI00345EE9C6
MSHKTFYINDYIRVDEAYHFARKDLARRFPDAQHDHDYFEVALIEEGQTEHRINGMTQQLKAGQLIFIRPRDVHAFRADPKTGCRIVNIMFRSDTAHHLANRYASSIAGRFFDSKESLPEEHSLGSVRFDRALSVARPLQTGDRSLARIEEFLLTLTNRVADFTSPTNTAAPRWFTDACTAAQSREVFRRGTEGFVSAAGRSHEHVCRTCQDVLGLTPSAYINQIRIDHAAHLLRSDEASIEDIAAACGYDNTSYFYRLFRSQYGTTPRSYRLRHQRDPFEREAS